MNAIAELRVKVDTAVDPLERTRALRDLATMLARHGRFERSLEYARLAVEIASRECDVVAADEARLSQVGCHVFAKEFLAALELALEVAERSNHRDDFRLAALALASAGVCEHQLGATEEADSSLTQAIALAERCGTDALGATGCCALGRKLLIAHRFDEAEVWLRKGLALVDSRDFETRCQILVELSGILSNRGTALLEVDPEWGIANVQEALERLRLARAEAVSADSRYWEGNCVLGAGVNLFTLQRYEESKRSICEALDIAMTLGESIQIAASRFHLGRLQLNLGEYRGAIDQLTHVSAMVPDLGSRSYFPADACRLLSDAYEKVGDLPNALRFLRQHQRKRPVSTALNPF